MFKKTGIIKWAKHSYECRRLAVDIGHSFLSRGATGLDEKRVRKEWNHVAYTSGFAGESAGLVTLDLQKNDESKEDLIQWGRQWYDCELMAAELLKSTKPEYAAHAFSYAGKAADVLFRETKDILWGKKSYDAYIQSAEIAPSEKFKAAMYGYKHAGDAARMINKETRNLAWARKAVIAYTEFLERLEQNPLPEFLEATSIVRGHVEFLQRLVTPAGNSRLDRYRRRR